MTRDIKLEKPFGFLMMFLLTFFSYRPMRVEIAELAANATLTNAIIEMLDQGAFMIIWIVLAVVFLFGGLYYLVAQL